MKILVVTPIFPPEIGGPATYSAELVHRLPPEVGVFVTGFGKDLVPVAGGMILRQIRLFWSCLKFGRDVDIFYLQEPAVVGLAGWLAGRLLRKKVVIKFVGDPEWEEQQRGGHPRGILSVVTGFVLRANDRVVVPANHLADWLVKKYRVRRENIVVIANSVDRVKEEKKVSGRIVYVGRLAPWKNVDLILKAAKLLKERRVKFSLIIANGLSRARARKEIAKSEILVLFSDYEGLSHVIIEAMAAETAVVASDIPGNKELVKDRETGLLVEQKNVGKLAGALEELLRSRKKRQQMAQKAYELVKKEYSWDNNLVKLKNVFNQVASFGGSS